MSEQQTSETAELSVVEQGRTEQYHVKVRLVGRKRFEFLTTTGGTTHLLVHAPTWNEQSAREVAAHIVADNPEAVAEARAVLA